MLFSADFGKNPPPNSRVEQPLAARLRPRTFSEFVGQEHLLGAGKPLRVAIDNNTLSSLILFGPPGVGKTTIAALITATAAARFERLSAVVATVSDIRRCIENAAREWQSGTGRRTYLFIDEIHRFNKAQQDVLLPDVENGTIRLIGATTENPFFHVIGPLLSRSQVYQLHPLMTADILSILDQACQDERGFPGWQIHLLPEAAQFIAESCEGDARKALNILEVVVTAATQDNSTAAQSLTISLKQVENALQTKAIDYGADGHYDTISAFIKSMRGSDPNAAIYWLAKMLYAGEDLRFIARRIIIFAAEDVGNADPRALVLAVNALQAVQAIGMPEARIILAQAVTFCATCPKSNASYLAINRAMHDVEHHPVASVPVHLRDAHYAGAKRLEHGKGYQYPHDYPGHFIAQEYLPEPRIYYEPADSGYETRIKERMRDWNEQRKNTTA